MQGEVLMKRYPHKFALMHIRPEDQKALVSKLPEDLYIRDPEFLSEKDFLKALADKVAYMLQYNSGVLFQWLYKIDVLEPKLRNAMQHEDVAMSIARLILERQLESLASRKTNPSQPAADKDLEW